MPRSYVDFINDIIDAVEKAQEFVEGMDLAGFLADPKTLFAVANAISIIGEATKYVPPGIRQQYAQIPWQDMAAMRNILVHEYFRITWDTVWRTVEDDFPGLLAELRQIEARFNLHNPQVL